MMCWRGVGNLWLHTASVPGRYAAGRDCDFQRRDEETVRTTANR